MKEDLHHCVRATRIAPRVTSSGPAVCERLSKALSSRSGQTCVMAFTLSSRAVAPQARLSVLPTRRVASVPVAPPLLRSRPAAPASVVLPARGGFRAALAGASTQLSKRSSGVRRLSEPGTTLAL
jgi:hypothetical protein